MKKFTPIFILLFVAAFICGVGALAMYGERQECINYGTVSGTRSHWDFWTRCIVEVPGTHRWVDLHNIKTSHLSIEETK